MRLFACRVVAKSVPVLILVVEREVVMTAEAKTFIEDKLDTCTVAEVS